MNPFELIKPTPYVSQHVGLPLEELKVAAQNVTQRKAENDAIIDDLELMMTNFGHVPEDVAGKKAIEDAKLNINKSLEELSKLEFGTVNPKARNILKNVLRENVLKNKDLNQTLQNYAAYQDTQKKLDELRLSNKQILDLSTGPFSSFTEDADGNKTYNTYRNPYQVRHEDRTKVQEESIKAFLVEDYLRGNVDSPKTMEEYMKMPYDQLIQTLGIDQTQINSKLSIMQDRYLQTDQGRQEYDEYYSALRREGISDEKAEIQARNRVKENIKNRAEGFNYERKQVQFKENENPFFKGTDGKEFSEGLMNGPTISGATLKKNSDGIKHIVTNNFKPGSPEQAVKVQLNSEMFLADPELKTSFMDMLAEQYIGKGVSKEDATKNVLYELKTDYPQAFKAAMVTGTFNPGAYYAQVYSQLKNEDVSQDKLEETDPVSKAILEASSSVDEYLRKGADHILGKSPNAKTKGSEAFKKFEQVMNDLSQTYYKDDIDDEDNNAFETKMIAFDNSTDEGKRISSGVTEAAKKIGSGFDVVSLINYTEKEQEALGKFTPNQITNVEQIGNLHGKLVFAATVSGEYEKQEVKGNVPYQMIIELKDPSVIDKILSVIPQKEATDFEIMRMFSGYKLAYGKDYYLDGNGKEIKYPENIRITNTPKGYSLLDIQTGRLVPIEGDEDAPDNVTVSRGELYKLFSVLDKDLPSRMLEEHLESTYELPKGFISAVIGTESKNGEKNPKSSAVGLGQFIKSTAEMLGIDPTNPSEARLGIAKYAKKHKKDLIESGLPVNATALYLSHLLGFEGYKSFYRNQNDKAVDLLRNFHNNPENVLEINVAEEDYDPNMTAGDFIKYHSKKFNKNI